VSAPSPPGGTVVEIGGGLGALTRPLLDRASRVVTIERDRDLVPILTAEFEGSIAEGRVKVIEADALLVDWAAEFSGPRPHVVAGNLPYQITGALLERATVLADRVDRAVFMVQAEVAERLAAKPGTKAYGGLTVFVQAGREAFAHGAWRWFFSAARRGFGGRRARALETAARGGDGGVSGGGARGVRGAAQDAAECLARTLRVVEGGAGGACGSGGHLSRCPRRNALRR
jgi:hypothetical protein